MKTKFLMLVVLMTQLFSLHAARVDTIQVKARKMKKVISGVVILPDSYTTSKRYPVMYLLHGASDNYKAWVNKCPKLKSYVDHYDMIVVCPDGGHTSWYFDSPVDETMQYESYVSKDFVGYIDSHYATIADRKGRAITGLSMGGHGALYLAFRHQDIWGAAGSMSGGVDFTPFPLNWNISKRLGDYASNREVWERNTVMDQVYLLTKNSLSIMIDCGKDDFFFPVNKALHERLDHCNIPHDFIVRPGKHNWNYWRNAIKYQMLFMNDYFESKK
ncbi:esterase family protein [Halosquirtibacter xylanolyticus]|uniref:alpha/beta hydrolase n=1 Tax=Halosquirtibacter xylanolyticus TaxID=3374599 RepID=UPI00374A60E5|nr:esterase family protein [Prolixibacteraceae bacterium]